MLYDSNQNDKTIYNIKNTIAKTNDGTIKSKCPNLGGKKLTLPKESI